MVGLSYERSIMVSSYWESKVNIKHTNETPRQCDRMAKLFLNIWPFTTLKICPKAWQICQSAFKLLPNLKINLKRTAKYFQSFAKSRSFAKCGHTEPRELMAHLIKDLIKSFVLLTLKSCVKYFFKKMAIPVLFFIDFRLLNK